VEIINGLADRTVLPPAHALNLLAEIEMRPFTKAMVLGEECRPHSDPQISVVRENLEAHDQRTQPPRTEADLSDQKIDEAYRRYAQRRRELMALLRTAIERNEPLRISA
jgi:hypothetical protein